MELLDVRDFTRSSDKIETRVKDKYSAEVFIKCGGSEIRGFQSDVSSFFSSYANRGATDVEHDSAYMIRFDIIDVIPSVINSRFSQYEAFIKPDSYGSFRVPSPDYNPFEYTGVICSNTFCDNKHPIIEYLPPQTEYTKNLYKKLYGERILIEWSVKM